MFLVKFFEQTLERLKNIAFPVQSKMNLSDDKRIFTKFWFLRNYLSGNSKFWLRGKGRHVKLKPMRGLQIGI
jgi:hypothetical protein